MGISIRLVAERLTAVDDTADIGKNKCIASNKYLLDLSLSNLSSLEFNLFQTSHAEGAMQATEKLSLVHRLNVSMNELAELTNSSVERFTRLAVLDASLNQIDRISISSLAHTLKYLNLSHNRISDLSFINQLSSLTHANLAMNEIRSLKPLTSLVNLHTINLSDNLLHSLQGIQALPYLKELQVQRNSLRDLSPVGMNVKLICLNAAHNLIDSLHSAAENLRRLSFLRSLILLGNPIESDIGYNKQLSKLPSLVSLDHITLQQSSSTDVPPLDKARKILPDADSFDSSSNFQHAATQLFWNQLALEKQKTEKNVRYLQLRILQHKQQYKDLETHLKTNIEPSSVSADDGSLFTHTSRRHLLPLQSTRPQDPQLSLLGHEDNRYPVYRPVRHGLDRIKSDVRQDQVVRPIGSNEYGDWDMLAAHKRQTDYSHIRHLQELLKNTELQTNPQLKEPSRRPNRTRGNFKHIRDTDEVLRLTSNKLLQDLKLIENGRVGKAGASPLGQLE